MAKRFRLRLRRAFPAAFRSCRDDDPVVAAAAVASSACCLPPDSSDCFSFVEQLPPTPFRRSPPRYFRSASASGPRRKTDYDDSNTTREKGDGRRLRRRRRQRRETIRRIRSNSSSAVEDSGWFSSGELDMEFDYYYGEVGAVKEEMEALISSTDVESSDSNFWQQRTKTVTGRDGCGGRRSWAAEDAAVAVVKRSEDTREDFRRSMAEMVVNKKIFDAAGLEQLLLCFLSLNARDHHAAIIAAFGDVWAAVSPASGGGHRRWLP